MRKSTANVVEQKDRLHRVRAMRKTDLAYFAGLFDGEGWVNNIGKLLPRPDINVGSTSPAIIGWLLEQCGGKVDIIPPNRRSKLLALRWRLTSEAAFLLFRRAWPYFTLKREQVAPFITAWEQDKAGEIA